VLLKRLASKLKTLTSRELKDDYDKNDLSSSSMPKKMISMGDPSSSTRKCNMTL
jgi:hypothetical protein